MNFLFLVNIIVSLTIIFLLVKGFIKFRKEKDLVKIISYFSITSVFYLLVGLASFLWFFDFLSFLENDFLVLYSIVVFLQSLLFSKLIVLISKNRKLYYFLLFYFVVFFSIFYSWSMFFIVLSIVSFFLCFLFFIDLTFRSDFYDRVGYIGMLYSCLGAIFFILSVFFLDLLFLFSIILGIVFLILIYVFLKDLSLKPPSLENVVGFKDKPYLFKILGHLVFIIVLTNLVFIGTIAIHEFGHFSVAKFYGCEAEKIVYEKGYFHTEVLCKDDSKNFYVFLGGILFPFFLAIFLFFLGGKFMRDISILIAGFNFLSVSRDLSELGISNNIIFVSIFFGILFLITGIIILARSKVEEDIYLSGVVHG